MDNKQINLDVIAKQFRETGAAAKGFNTLNTLVRKNDVVGLRFLLRDHTKNPINSIIEIQERDNIDFYIDYFSILEIGLIAGYIPNPLPFKVVDEAEYLLNNEFINKYFTKFYPLILPQLLLKHITKHSPGKYFVKKDSIDSFIKFDRFLMLRQMIKQDSDIDQFLWFLDDGWTSGYSISDFWDVLSDKDIIRYKLGSSNKHPLNSALWGFIKYIQFLSDFANLLKETKNDALLQSAFWQHQSYWFEHMKEQIGDIIKIGIKNIRHSMNDISTDEIINNKKSFLNSEEDIEMWRKDTSGLEGIEDDINYLLDNKLGDPLKKFYNEV